jgi:addiction module RelE/StbE family toxin
MIKVIYTNYFLRSFKKLNPNLKDEVKEKIELFKNKENHQKLKVHKLQGKLAGRFAFSVNYSIRIIFKQEGESVTFLLEVGDHSIYN